MEKYGRQRVAMCKESLVGFEADQAFLTTEMTGEEFSSLWTSLEDIDQNILEYFGEILDKVIAEDKPFVLNVPNTYTVTTYNAAMYSIMQRRSIADKVAIRASENGNFIIVGPKDMVPGLHTKLMASDEGEDEVPENGHKILKDSVGLYDGMSTRVYVYPPFLQIRLIAENDHQKFIDGDEHKAWLGAHELYARDLPKDDYMVVVENPTSQPTKCTWSWELHRKG